MTLDLQQAAQRRMRRAVFVLTGIVLVLVAALVVIAVTGGDSGSDKGAPAPQPSNTAPKPAATLPEDDGGYVAPEKYAKLPDAAAKVGNLPVKFPRTPEGAAAMTVASARNAWSLDPAQVKAGILAYASAQYRNDMAAAAEDGAKGNREFAGVSASGPLPAGATLNAWPIGVKWAEVDSSSVDVLVLLRVTHAPKAGADSTTTLVVSPGRAVWESGDWKVMPTDPPKNLPDPVDVGSAKFNEDGWKAIQEGDRL
ncbi:hypothetical protein [Streptomyces sp. NBC_01750]|uniref:hypothetical protein n=1 Tax=Streptomyces sp. NBC_01750 TaxID=2975928 RepID=UPI002DDB6079|nr:hypothetical protein [Streptomyces sp. NBC_01750]WSD38146.1 hypothetical protein OG966_40555 [Streptomyces sp. NBC_01750]